MREQLIQYVNLLFAGTDNCEDIRQEILQNTLDRYDDLIAAGKVPEAAYRLAIAGIGDINEILGTSQPNGAPVPPKEEDPKRREWMQAIAIVLFILCPTPILVLGSMGSDWMAVIGVCGLLVMVAIATALMVLSSDKEPEPPVSSPDQELRKSISALISTLGLVAYLCISLFSGAWHITWLLFPITGAIQGIAKAILNFKSTQGTKTNSVIRLIIWCVILVPLLIVLLSSTVTHVSDYILVPEVPPPVSTMESSVVVSGDQFTFPADKLSELKIDWVAGDIAICPADVTEITVSETGTSNQTEAMVFSVRDDCLNIQYSRNKLHIGISDPLSKNLSIYVPQDWVCRSLEIDTASADLSLRDLTIRELELDGASGRCDIQDCQITDLNIDTASGDVVFTGTLDTLDFDAASASFTAKLTNTPRQIEVDSMSGQLDLTLPEDCGYTVNMDGLSRNFHSDYGTAAVHGDGRCHIEVDGLSSGVTIRRPAA